MKKEQTTSLHCNVSIDIGENDAEKNMIVLRQ